MFSAPGLMRPAKHPASLSIVDTYGDALSPQIFHPSATVLGECPDRVSLQPGTQISFDDYSFGEIPAGACSRALSWAPTQQGDDVDPIVANWVADGIVLFGENLFGMRTS